MAYKEATDRELYSKLTKFYPVVEPGNQFVSNLFEHFENNVYSMNTNSKGVFILGSWNDQISKWLPENVGLLRNPDDADNWNKFIVVDPKLYAFALLRYS